MNLQQARSFSSYSRDSSTRMTEIEREEVSFDLSMCKRQNFSGSTMNADLRSFHFHCAHPLSSFVNQKGEFHLWFPFDMFDPRSETARQMMDIDIR